MGLETAAYLALASSAASAYSSYEEGKAMREEGYENAKLLKQKAALIDVQKGVEAQQYNRLANRTMGTTLANAAASGLDLGGSTMAVMIDTQKQIALDKAIGQFELEQQKRFTLAEAEGEIRRGKIAQRKAYVNAFSTMLRGGATAAYYGGWGQPINMGTYEATRAGG